MNKLRKQIALVFVALFATVCVFSSCSEEEFMIDAEREHKVQELLRVSRSLADQHEIAMCFTEQMIRGGIDTLTVEDLEQAYEVYAANTVDFYLCTDSVKANENGLKLSRSSRMAREVILLPGEGGTFIRSYTLTWWPFPYSPGSNYDASMNVRVDWNSEGISGVVTLYPSCDKYYDVLHFIDYFTNTSLIMDEYGDLKFSTETFFQLHYGLMYCDFALWVEEGPFYQHVRLTLQSYSGGLGGTLQLSNDNQIT